MNSINRSRETYFLDKLLDQTFGEEASEQIRAFLSTEHVYVSATREIVTKLENLNDEFKYSRHHNPIHQVTARVKTPRRIVEKLARKGHEMTLASARQKGIAVIGMKILGAGHFIQPELGVTPELLIRYALSSGVTVAIAGCATAEEVQTLADAAAQPPLAEQERGRLLQIFRPYAARLAFYRGVI